MNDLNVKNIEIDKAYKYSDLCSIFKEERKTGKSKQLQIKNWQRYCNIEKGEKATFIIKEIYNKPKGKIDNRKGHSGKSEGSRNNYKGIYAEYIDVLLLQYLQREDLKIKNNCNIYTTNNKIAEGTGIVNHNYRTALEYQGRFYNVVKDDFDIKTNIYCMKDTFYNIKTKIRDIARASLERLQKAEKLEYEICYFVYIPYTTRLATEKELKIINEYEVETMEEMGVDHKKQIDNSDTLTKEFNTKVLEKVRGKLEYIESIYKGYSIILWTAVELKPDEELRDLMKEFNDLVLKSLKEKPQQMQEKIIKDEKLGKWFGSRSPFWKPWVFDRMSKKYIEHCYDFIDVLVNLESKNIVNEIKYCKNNNLKIGLTNEQKKEQEDKVFMSVLNSLGLNS